MLREAVVDVENCLIFGVDEEVPRSKVESSHWTEADGFGRWDYLL